MSGPDPDGLARLFDEALKMPPGAREAFLDRVCGTDAALRHELGSLLSVHDVASEYFDDLAETVVGPALYALADDAEEGLPSGVTVSHYRILEKIGAGGMGEVYTAVDLLLGRSVALKFLPRHLTSSATAQARFLAEAKAASMLDHPNIGVVHEMARSEDGRLFIAMTLYEGETLEQRIARGPIPVSEARAVAAQIASGLAAAHSKGIVHRDVKPSNILVTTDGVAKLLDFGIAKVEGSALTRQGPMPGTLGYMSPEQTRGERLDHRADIWSLGIVLYEMLNRARPFLAEDDQVLIHAIRRDPPRPMTGSPDAVPVMRIIERCLQKDPDLRYASAEELLADLKEDEFSGAADPGRRAAPLRSWPRWPRFDRRFVAVAVVAGLLLVAMVHWSVTRETASPADAAGAALQRLAVLPLANLSAEPDDSYVADAFTAELVGRLSGIAGLLVIAKTSTLPYRGTEKSASEVARELGVDLLLEGSVQKAGDRIRLMAHLIERTGEQLWGETYDVPAQDLGRVQGDVVRRVAEILRAEVDGGSMARIEGTSPPAPDAYVAYLKGRYFLTKWDEASTRKARDYFRQALDLDPTSAAAWTGWGESLEVLAWLSAIPSGDAYAQSEAAAERALRLDPNLADAHVSLARVLFRHRFRLHAAAEHLQRAIELNPSHAEARQQYAVYLRTFGRFDEALHQARLAADLDPLSPSNALEIGITLYLARHYDDALAQYRRLLDSRPDFTATHLFIALVHVQRGQYDRALEELERAIPDSRWEDVKTIRHYILAVTGREAEARAELDALWRRAPDEAIAAWHAATIHLGLREHEPALDLLERAYEHRSWQIPLLLVEPIFDPLRSHPRFMALVDRLRR